VGTATGRGHGTRSVLITDMVGSTALRSRLGDNAADRLRDEHERILRGAVEDRGGVVVKSTGDGIMAVFDAAFDAIACAVSMQQAVELQARRTGLPVQIRIGISAGDVTWDADDYHGTPVVEAARLEPKAPAGGILASALVKLLAGSRTDVTFVSAGALELKGLPEPLDAYEIEWSPAAADDAMALPSALSIAGQNVFVGRRPECERLTATWVDVRAGATRVVVLTGEAGIGKTRLAAEIARHVHDDGGAVLFGRCDEDLDVPYQPFVEALSHFVASTQPAYLREELGPGAGELVRLLPDLGERLPGLAPAPSTEAETARYRLFEAVASWLAAASEPRPLLLVVDDMQWASKATTLLVRHLVRSDAPMRVLLLLTWRDTDTGERDPLVPFLAETARTGKVERVAMPGLARGEVVQFLEEAVVGVADDAAARRVSERLGDALYTKTEGNPFFVQEMTNDLLDVAGFDVVGFDLSGFDVSALGDDALARFGVPETVRDVVLRRVGRLDADVERVLGTAAVVGRTFDAAVLEDVLDAGGDTTRADDVVDLLDTAVTAGLVRERSEVVGRFEFAHALVRDVLYGQLSATKRSRLHERTATALERIHADAPDEVATDVAAHLLASGRADPHHVIAALLRAGEVALRSLEYEQAVASFEQALSVLEQSRDATPVERIDVLLAVGGARMRVLDHAGSKKALQQAADEARILGDPDRLANAALGMLRHAQPLVKEFGLATLADEALAALPDTDSGLRAKLLAIRAATSFLNTYEGPRLDLVAEAVAMAQRLGDPGDLAYVLAGSVLATFGPAMLEERLRYVDMQLDAAERSGHTEAACEARGWRATARIESGRRAGVDEDVEAMTRLADELGQPWYKAMAQQRTAMVAQLSGDHARAESLANLALSASTPDQIAVVAGYAGLMWALRRDQGRLAEVEPAFQAFASQMPDVAAWRATLAITALELGRRDDARDKLRALAGDGLAGVPMDWLWLAAMSLSGEVAAALAERDIAQTVYDLLLPYARRGVPIAIGVGYLGTTSRPLGLLAGALGDHDAAVAHLEDAVELEVALEAPAYEARARLALADALQTRGAAGDDERAATLLGEAARLSDDLGLVTVAAQIAARG
jgi:class 3 adenylate cyclase/tetratricopeptide (TPR) repeat protein